MAKNNKNENQDGIVRAEDALALAQFNVNDFILDGADVITESLGGETPKGVIVKVVKLMNTPENPNPALRGKFLGYEPISVTAPGTERKSLMNFVLVEVRPGIILKHLGTAQIMQGLAIAKLGQNICIIKPNLPDIEIAGGKRVKRFDVIIERGSVEGSMVTGHSKPFGEWGEKMAFAAPRTVNALPAGEERVDPTTGEVTRV